MQDTFQGKSVFWLGDSTARRASGTMYGVLNGTRAAATTAQTTATSVAELDHFSIIDVNKKNATEPCQRHAGWTQTTTGNNLWLCRTMPRNTRARLDDDDEGDWIYIDRPCLYGVNGFLHDELDPTVDSNILQHVNVLIVALGIWHSARPHLCRTPNLQDVTNYMNEAFEFLFRLEQARPDLTIVWRTAGFSSGHHPQLIYDMNAYAMDRLDQHMVMTISRRARQQQQTLAGLGPHGGLTYVHWGRAMEPRSFRAERIAGDIPAHYGLEPRLTLAQMITNVLREQQQPQDKTI